MARAKRIRVSLKGPDAALGRVPAADVGKLLIGLERILAQAATVITGGQVTVGRRTSVVESSTRFRLVKVQEGSVVAILELPEVALGQPALDINDQKLNEFALRETLRTLAGDEGDVSGAPFIAGALLQLADELAIGSRYESVDIDSPRSITPRRRVRLDNKATERLRAVASQAPSRPGTVVGVLVEADFEKLTAHVRTPEGRRVSVVFPDQLADAIHEALRDRAELEGLVTYDPKTAVATQVRLRSLARGHQLNLGIDPSRFWEHKSVQELAKEQGVGPVQDPSTLLIPGLTQDEAEAFLASLPE
jgi:hypothetical protein